MTIRINTQIVTVCSGRKDDVFVEFEVHRRVATGRDKMSHSTKKITAAELFGYFLFEEAVICLFLRTNTGQFKGMNDIKLRLQERSDKERFPPVS